MNDSSRLSTCQQVVYTGTSATCTNVFGAETFQIRVAANSACHIKVVEAAGGDAATTDPFLPANWVEYITVTPGQKISAIRAATDGLVTATSGTLSVTELT